MQTKNPIFDDLAEMMTGAAGVVASAGEEVKAVARSRVDRIIADMDLVSREEFELVKDMAIQARAENESLRQQIAALTAKSAKKPKAKKTTKTSGVK